MKKQFVFLILCMFMLAMLAIPSSAYVPGETIGEILNSEIVAYIDERPIRSYNIKGNTYIVAEDLTAYGFTVTWHPDEELLKIGTTTINRYTSTYKPSANTAVVGTRAGYYYYTNIRTKIGSDVVTSYNIGGYTCICMDDLAKYFKGTYVWDSANKALRLTTKRFEQAKNSTTTSEKPNLQYSNVKSMNTRNLQYDSSSNKLCLVLSFFDQNNREIKTNATIDIRIQNKNGEVVYSEKHNVSEYSFGNWTTVYGLSWYAVGVYIPVNKITPGSNENGTMYYKITLPDGSCFPEMSYDLPYGCKLPSNGTQVGTVSSMRANNVLYRVGDDFITLVLSFRDENFKLIACTADVAVKIINNNGETVYSKVFKIKPSDFSYISYVSGMSSEYCIGLKIPQKDIKGGSTYNGNIYYQVTTSDGRQHPEGSYFIPYSFKLPMKAINLITPSLPQVYHEYDYRNNIERSCRITDVKYSYSEYGQIEIFLSGEKTYDEKGSGYGSYCQVGWRLCDKNGYVVDSGTFNSPAIKTGDKFKDHKLYIFYDFIPGETYKLLLDNSI